MERNYVAVTLCIRRLKVTRQRAAGGHRLRCDSKFEGRYTDFFKVSNFFQNIVYIGLSDVTESMVTIRLPFCGYNSAFCVELKGEDLWSYSHKIESVSLRKCPYDY